MKRYFFLCLLLGLSFCLILNTQAFAAGKTLYDDFSSNYIDGSKWQQRTIVREIVDEQFISKLGNRTPGMGAEIAPGIFRNNLSFANSETINAIECEITVAETKLDSAPNSISFARIGGFFYNINQAGGVTGDIYAQVKIGDRGNGGLEAFWEVMEILSDDPSSWDIFGTGTEVIGTGTIIAPGTLSYNTPYKVKISYDGDRSFSFTANEINDSFIGPTKNRVAVFSSRQISSAIEVANGSNNGFIFAKFDNVYINDQQTVYEDFSSPPLDPDKWRELEDVREISNGSLRTSIRGYDSTRQVTTVLSESDASYFEAKVRILSDSQLPQGTTGIARIQGFYYNDSKGPGSGQDYNKNEGDVFVQVRLESDDNGHLKARAWVDKSEDANQTIWTTLFDQYFTTPIQLDTDYVLSIEYANSQLIFKCNNETLSYAITTPEYSPFGEHRALRSRVYLDPGESGYIKVQFDDVYIDSDCSGDGWETIQGTVTYNGTPLCAMVLANGQYMFSCDPIGEYQLCVPLDSNGEITLFAFVDGLAPFKVTSEPSSLPSNIEMELASPDSKMPTVTSTVVESIDNPGWVEIEGTVSLDGIPLCAMVLANGQYMFSCDPDGEYQLTVPLDPNGEITLFTFVDGLQPYKEIFSP